MDVESLRADTPGCQNRNHLNNAGAGLMPSPVLRAITQHFELEAEVGGYEAADQADGAIKGAYGDVARLLGTTPKNVAFTEHATASFIQALSSIRFEAGDTIVTTRNDYNSNQIQFRSLSERFGVRIVRAADLPEGGVDPDDIRRCIEAHRPKLVAVTWIPTNSGLVQPVEAIGQLCRERDINYLIDGCQAVGQMPIDVGALGCDFFSATSRKFLRGPRGSGFLYVSDRVLREGLEPMFLDLRGADWVDPDRYVAHPDASRFESWEFAWGLVLGTGAAARYASDLGLEAIRDRAWALARRFREGAATIDGIRVLDRGQTQCAIATFHARGVDPLTLTGALRGAGINYTRQGRGSAVLDMDDKGVDWLIRISPHYYNTEAEIDQCLAVIEKAL